jgi:hypothetical protein
MWASRELNQIAANVPIARHRTTALKQHGSAEEKLF